MKNRNLNQWLWKWHFIAGIIALPFVLVLSITGTIYLFKSNVEAPIINKIQKVEKVDKKQISYEKQFEIAKKHLKKSPNNLVLSNSKHLATEFNIGRFSHKKSVFVNPYTKEISGNFSPKSTWMHTVRKLHGELLGGKIGTKIVELIASWLIILIITGLCLWFPFHRGLKGIFTIRINQGKRLLFRDLHAVSGFWISGFLLVILAGGLPWTDVFGSNFKWVQKVTNTGYPKTWNGKGLTSTISEKRLTLDDMVIIANQQQLKGVVSVGLPKTNKNTFSVSNTTPGLDQQKMLHFDQYSGKLVKEHRWCDVGFLMRGRMWVMAFHQGQFGGWNWWLVFIVANLLTFMSIAAIISYVYRKPKGSLGIPKRPVSLKSNTLIIGLIFLLSILLPLLGISIVLILFYEKIVKSRAS